MKRIIYFSILIITLFIYNSCDDVLSIASEKIYSDINPPSEYMVVDFKAEEGANNREVILTWTNPNYSTFEAVVLLRRSDDYPVGYNDSSAVTLYGGTNQRYTDSNLTPNKTYYYAVFAKDNKDKYSDPNYASKQVTETALDIRKRSFFLIGGSNNKIDPTGSAADNPNLVSTIEIFDPVTETVSSVTTTGSWTPRVFCNVASLNNKIYVFGGYNYSGAANTVETDVDILDIDTLTWSQGASWAQASVGLRTVVWNNKIYCLGGSTATTTAGANSASAINTYIYDPSTDAFSQNDNTCQDIYTTTGRCVFSAAAYNGMIYYLGGVRETGAYLNTGAYHNILTNQRVNITVPAQSAYLGATSSIYQKSFDNGDELTFLLVIGGSSDNTETALPAANINLGTNYAHAMFMPNVTGTTPACYRVYPSAGANTGIENYINRMYAGAEYHGDYVYYIGGINAAGNPIYSIERLDVNDGNLTGASWSAITATLSSTRYGFAITRVND